MQPLPPATWAQGLTSAGGAAFSRLQPLRRARATSARVTSLSRSGVAYGGTGGRSGDRGRRLLPDLRAHGAAPLSAPVGQRGGSDGCHARGLRSALATRRAAGRTSAVVAALSHGDQRLPQSLAQPTP